MLIKTDSKPTEKRSLIDQQPVVYCKKEDPKKSAFYTPAPYYTCFDENSIQKQLSDQKSYLSQIHQKNLDLKTSKIQNTYKQAPVSPLLQSSKIFDSIEVINFPVSLYKNKLYVIGQMNPTFNKVEKNSIKITDSSTLDVQNRYNVIDDQPQKVSNMMDLPVFIFVEKTWSIEKFRIKSFSTLSSNWSFLHTTRIYESKLREKIKETEVQNVNNNYVLPKKASQKQKPIIYFPNQLVNQAYCKDSESPEVIYLFGGVHQQKLTYSNKMWKIDLEEKSIQMIEQRGDCPDACEGGSLCFYSSQWIILYGGYNLMNCQIFNQFYAFSIENKSWSIIDTDFDSYYTPRINFSFSYNPTSKACYLFGGMIFDYNNRECLLDDMYEFKVIELDYTQKRPSFHRKIKGSIETKTLLSKKGSKWPKKLQGHKTFWIDKNLMVLLGGQCVKDLLDMSTTYQNSLENYESQNDLPDRKSLNQGIWIFDRRTEDWVEVLSSDLQFQWKGSSIFSIDFSLKNFTECELIVFGGYSELNVPKMNKLFISFKQYNDAIRRNQIEGESFKNCQTCINKEFYSQKILQDQVYSPIFSVQIINQYIFNSIPFVFTAFGQLTSLAAEKQSSRIVFSYISNHHPKEDAYIKIEQDGYLPYTADQIAQKIHQFSVHDSLEIHGVTDKKYKMYQNRLNLITQFCNRMKIAALRLGEEVFFIATNTNNQILVFLLKAQEYPNNLSENPIKIYQSYFYAVNETTLELLPQFSEQIKTNVAKSYDKLIQKFYKEKKNVKSFMKISQLRKVWCGQPAEQKYQMTPDFQRNTILINFETLIERKATFYKGLLFEESIDINLKAYLSIFFLTRQIKILLQVNTTGTNPSSGMTKFSTTERADGQKRTNQTNQPSKFKSAYVLKVQEVIGSQSSSSNLFDLGAKITNNQKKQGEEGDVRDKITFPSPSQIQTVNKLEEVNFQFMLPKIDEKLQTGELIEIQSDVFGEFDCKIVEVYYWLGKKPEITSNKGENYRSKNTSTQKQDLTYSNGLLIYHKGQLVKRYKYDLGVLLLRQKFSTSHQSKLQISQKNIDQFHRSLAQFNTRLFGIIQVSDKYQINIFGTDFLNQEFLENLYQRIQHVSILYEKMYGTWNGVRFLKRPIEEQSHEAKQNQKIENSERFQSKNFKKKVKKNEDFSNKQGQ